MQFTEDQILAAARVLSDRSAKECNINKEDNWDLYCGQFIDDAKAALSALSAAAPQVVADERKLPPLPQYFPDIINIRADEELRAQDYATQYARAALQATPVQAQEPVAFKEVGSFLYVGVEYVATSSDDPRGIKLYRPTVAPVQPVAVPDGKYGRLTGDNIAQPVQMKVEIK